MKEYLGLLFTSLEDKDISLLTQIMREAFDRDTREHLGIEGGGPTGYDDGSLLRKYISDKAYTSYKIITGSNTVGAVILKINQETNENFLELLFIAVDLENQGIGETVWHFVEKEYPDTKIWRSETPAFSRRNHNFYVNKCGFHIVKIKNPRDYEESYFLLEKVMRVSSPTHKRSQHG